MEIKITIEKIEDYRIIFRKLNTMKKSVRGKYHTGLQPIRVLKHNLTDRLLSRSKEFIELLQKDLQLSEHINYISYPLL